MALRNKGELRDSVSESIPNIPAKDEKNKKHLKSHFLIEKAQKAEPGAPEGPVLER